MVERECDVEPMNGFRIAAFCRGADSVERALWFWVGLVGGGGGGGGGSKDAFDCTVIQNNLIARHHTDNALRPTVHPFLVRNGPAFRFQQYHVAMIMLNVLNAKGVNVLPCPSLSQDLNPVEQIWGELGRRDTGFAAVGEDMEWRR